MNKSIHIGNWGHNKEIPYLWASVKMFFVLTQTLLKINQIRKRNIVDVTSVRVILTLLRSFDDPGPRLLASTYLLSPASLVL